MVRETRGIQLKKKRVSLGQNNKKEKREEQKTEYYSYHFKRKKKVKKNQKVVKKERKPMYRREERSGGKRSGTKERSCLTDNADKLTRSKGGKKVNKKMDE